MEFAASTLVATVAVVMFAVTFLVTGLVPVARNLLDNVSSGVSIMLDSSLDDEAKETAVRSTGIKLIVGAWKVCWRLLLALSTMAVPILLAHIIGLATSTSSLGILLRVDFIIVVSVIALLALFFISRGRANAESEKKSGSYGYGEKIVHAVAFSSPKMHTSLAYLDDKIFSTALGEVAERPPIFITSLARGGTTALLNALHHIPTLATHRYSDMPFISAPIMWSKIANKKRTVVERQRDHGDGLTIGLHSPEAFDEIFWHLLWPEKYSEKTISLWKLQDQNSSSTEFMRRHFKKIIAIRYPESDLTNIRYLSKNNANIARLDVLPSMFPRCDVVIALRDPAAHAASMCRQHKNFSILHADDDFTRRYMQDIGHFEFGALHRPIAFNKDQLSDFKPDDPNYWLSYWISAFEHVCFYSDSLTIVTQDALRSSPNETMNALLEKLDMNRNGSQNFTTYFRTSHDEHPDELFKPVLLDYARDIYERLSRQAIN